MKTKIKRHSRSVLSVILAVCMLVTCFTVGLVATDAAKAESSSVGAKVDDTDSSVGAQIDTESVGWDNYFIKGSFNGWTAVQITDSYNNENGKLCYTATLSNDDEFGFTKGSATGTYIAAKSSEGGDISTSISGKRSTKVSGQKTNFVFKGDSGTYLICLDLNNHESDPWVWIEEVAAPSSYYLHYAKTDAGMTSTTGVAMTESNGVYTCTVSNYSNNTSNHVNSIYFNVTDSSSATNTTSVTGSVSAQAGMNNATSGEYSNYKYWRSTMATSPQNITFTFDPSTGNLTVSGSVTPYIITAGGSTSDYTLTATGGNTMISNAGTTSSTFYSGTTITVTVTPANNTKKVTAITNCSSVTDNGDGTYTGTFNVSAASTITATLENKSQYAVNFGTNNASYGTVEAAVDGSAITSGSNQYESTTVTFTAKPASGYGVVGWYSNSSCTTEISGAGTSATYKAVVTGVTNAYAKFAKVGYKVVVDSGNTEYEMTQLSSGLYICTNPKIESPGYAFKLKRDIDGYYSTKKSTGVDTRAGINKVSVTWGTTTTWNDDYLLKTNSSNYTGYITYDPVNDKVWLSDNSDGRQKVIIVAKDGTVRQRMYSDGNYNVYSTFARHADTTVVGIDDTLTDKTDLEAYLYYTELTGTDMTWYDGTNINTYSDNSTKEKCGEVAWGYTSKKIRITTTLQPNSAYKSDYYVAGYCINGETPQLFTPNDSGVYTMDYTIPEDMSIDYLEITPIYFLKDSSKCVTFYIRDYDSVKSSWGNTVAVYPYYHDANGTDIFNRLNVYGGYPGQPVINYGGYRYIQIPTEYTFKDGITSTTGYIEGVTLSNYYWDDVHSNGSNKSNGTMETSQYLGVVSSHKQTYDYDDFYRIYDQKKSGDLADIIFQFKYETTLDNGSVTPSDSELVSTYANGNGWEDLLDYYNRPVDLFGNVITSSGGSYTPSGTLYVVSDGYAPSYAGRYATRWYVYSNSGGALTKIADIAPSALIMNSKAAVEAETTAASGTGIAMSDFADEYDTLSAYTNYAVKITYEKEILNDSTYRGTKGTSDYSEEANRSDGRWFYSKSTDLISANIKIQYCDDYYTSGSSKAFIDDDFISGTNKGTHTLGTAYFTNTTNNYAGNSYYGLTESGEVLYSKSEKFTFEATTSSEYMFLGWYLEDGSSYSKITDPDVTLGDSLMTANATYVARFVKAPSGSLRISHSVETNTTYVGSGTAYLSVYIFDTQANATAYMANPSGSGVTPLYIQENVTSDITIPATRLTFSAATNQYAYVKLTTTPTVASVFANFNGGNSSVASTVITNAAGTAVGDSGRSYTISKGFALQDILQQDGAYYIPKIAVIPYVSHLDRYRYSIVYTYPSRKYDNQKFTVANDFTDAEYTEYVSSGNLTKAFVQKNCPYEDNFMKEMSWNFNSGVTYGTADSGKTYTAAITATQTEVTTKTLQFVLPYEYNSESHGGVTVYTAKTKSPIYDTTVEDPSSVTVGYQSTYSGVETADGKSVSYYTQAPASVKVGETSYPFQYWSIKLADTKTEVARCYSINYNFAAFNDYIVTPVFSNTGTGSISSDISTSLTLNEYSRNQWNEGDKGTRTTDRTAMDTVYADFDISFANAGELIDESSSTEIGVIVENLGTLALNERGEYITDMSTYSTKPQFTSALKEFIKSNGGTEAKNTYKTASGSSNITKVTLDKSKITNKNRIEYYLGINASENGADLTNRTSLYRIYSYIKSGNTVTLSSPVYINIYAEAAK